MFNSKISRKIVFLFLVWSICLGGFVAFNTGNLTSSSNGRSYVLECLENSSVKYDINDYTNFTGPPLTLDGFKWYRVFIDDTNVSHTWDHYVATYDWCTGSGTEQDPYIIEKLYIDAQGFGGCIGVFSSGDKHFIIKDCWLQNGGTNAYNSGVFVRWAANGKILNNVFIDVHEGVYLELDCFNTTVADNIMVCDNRIGSRGLFANWATGSTFYNNKMLDFYHGTRFTESNNLTIESNFIENRERENYVGGSPLRLANVDYCDVVRNIFAGVFAQGVIRVTESDSVDNVIEHNYIITDSSYVVDFNITIAGDMGLRTAQDDIDTIDLDGSDHNYIAYNAVFRPDGGGIPGYDPILIIGLLCTISVMITIFLKRKSKN